MDTILIAGVESVVGANLAASLSDRHRLVGLSLAASSVSIANCETAFCPSEEAEAVRQWVASVRPRQVVYCGPAGRSAWSQPDLRLGETALAAVANWAGAAQEFEARFTLISSDAVFTGPWMFHTETSHSHCESAAARAILAAEQQAVAACRRTLVVRTHAYGWSPGSAGHGWIERLLSDLEAETAGPFDPRPHATPILASDLADILSRAWAEELQGIYHVAGAERVNPCRFAERLAEEFDLDTPLRAKTEPLSERPCGFGRGETSLHTKKVRKALCVAMPMLGEGLERLREQAHNGYRDRLEAPRAVHGRVA